MIMSTGHQLIRVLNCILSLPLGGSLEVKQLFIDLLKVQVDVYLKQLMNRLECFVLFVQILRFEIKKECEGEHIINIHLG